jgi:hypothetical protein
MYRYNDPAKDVRGLTNFALNKFKSTAGHRVPQPPTALENFYEHLKEKALDIVVSFWGYMPDRECDAFQF